MKDIRILGLFNRAHEFLGMPLFEELEIVVIHTSGRKLASGKLVAETLDFARRGLDELGFADADPLDLLIWWHRLVDRVDAVTEEMVNVAL